MDQPVPSSELNLENVGKDSTSPQSIVVEETAGCHCKPQAEPELLEKVEEEVKEECPPPPPVCRDPPAEEPPQEEPAVAECPPCAPCPPCPGPAAEIAPEEPEVVEEKPEEEEPEKFPRAPCPDPLYPPCKTAPAPCQQIVCPQDD